MHDIHGLIIKLYTSIGYVNKEMGGCCFGLSMRWLESCLSDEKEIFHDRMIRISEYNETLAFAIRAVKTKKGKNLTKEEKKLLDILSFFDSAILYQLSNRFSPLFNQSKKIFQHEVESIFYFASSDKIKALGGLTKLYSELFIYTKAEILDYFDALGLVLEHHCPQSNETFGLILSCRQHAIALTYQIKKGWTVMDINQYPPLCLIERQFFKYFLPSYIDSSFEKNMHPYFAFNLSLFTLGNYSGLTLLKESLDQFKNSHFLTKELADRSENKSLAHLAARYGMSSVIAELATLGANLNVQDKDGWAPIHYAADFNQIDVIYELAKNQVDLGIKDRFGFTALDIARDRSNFGVIALLERLHNYCSLPPVLNAVINGNSNALIELAKQGVDLNQKGEKGDPLVFSAVINCDVDMIAVFATNGVDLNQKDQQGIPLVFYPVFLGDNQMLAEMVKYGAKLNQWDQAGHSLAWYAANFGYVNVIAELAKHKEADLNATHISGAPHTTPLYTAASQGHADVIAELIKNNVEVSPENVTKFFAPAFTAVYKGHDGVIAEFIKYGVDLTLSYKGSINDLRAFLNYEEEVEGQEHMIHLVDQKLGEELITLTLCDLASIMGRKNIVQLLNKAKKITALHQSINSLLQYGKELASAEHGLNTRIEGEKVIDFAYNIEKLASRYIRLLHKPEASGELAEVRKEFNTKLSQGFQAMNKHRAKWKPILINIVIAATGVGLIFLLSKYIATGSAFFSRTERQIRLNAIEQHLQLLG